MVRTVRLFLLFEAATFVVASLIHSGVVVGGDVRQGARVAESVIALVLLAGLVLTWVVPHRVRPVGLAAQGVALLGTLLGLFAITRGIGLRPVPDVIYHIAIAIVLVWGMATAARMPAVGERGQA